MSARLHPDEVMVIHITDRDQPWTHHEARHLVDDAYGTACGLSFQTPISDERIEAYNESGDGVYESPLDVTCLRCWGTERFRNLVLSWNREGRL